MSRMFYFSSVKHPFQMTRPSVKPPPFPGAVRRTCVSPPSVLVTTDEGGRMRRGLVGLHGRLARAQKQPFTLMGGQSVLDVCVWEGGGGILVSS